MSVIRLLHRGYKLFLSPLLVWIGGPGSGCRFEPSCSDYALEAIETHGLWTGVWLGVKRLARCQPWGGQGCDPVPPSRVLGARTLGSPVQAQASAEKSASAAGESFRPRPLGVPVPR